jgi:hypothetical protein
MRLPWVKHWENEFRAGWYCWFRGEVVGSRLLKIELAGTLCIELGPEREDETDMFVFVNGVRTGSLATPNKYLWRRGSDPFIWDDQDPGFENWTTLDHFEELERSQRPLADGEG